VKIKSGLGGENVVFGTKHKIYRRIEGPKEWIVQVLINVQTKGIKGGKTASEKDTEAGRLEAYTDKLVKVSYPHWFERLKNSTGEKMGLGKGGVV